MKTNAMIMGELEYNALPDKGNVWLFQVYLFIFMILMSTVFNNFLVAMACTDIAAYRKESEIKIKRKRLETVFAFEMLLYGTNDHLWWGNRYFSRFKCSCLDDWHMKMRQFNSSIS